MPRKTLIFGNGLGMALSADAFSLGNALDAVWADAEALNDNQRNLIVGCLPPDTELGRPSSEEDLDVLQRVLASCDFLDSINIDGGAHWLSTEGRVFPSAIRKFIHRVASYFHDTNHVLPEDFAEGLGHFLDQTRSHVATLNYDPLLYDCFLNSNLMRGYNGCLIDGITNAGFRSENLFRRDKDRLGWYLHLHGSPLFYEGVGGLIKKMRRRELAMEAIESTHLVLSHVKHKTSIISSSYILSEYWKYLVRALEESSEIMLFGYSGYDTHLNEIVARHAKGRQVRVVEWVGSQPNNDRAAYWADRLKSEVDLVQLDNVLQFDDW